MGGNDAEERRTMLDARLAASQLNRYLPTLQCAWCQLWLSAQFQYPPKFPVNIELLPMSLLFVFYFSYPYSLVFFLGMRFTYFYFSNPILLKTFRLSSILPLSSFSFL